MLVQNQDIFMSLTLVKEIEETAILLSSMYDRGALTASQAYASANKLYDLANELASTHYLSSDIDLLILKYRLIKFMNLINSVEEF